MFAGIFSCTPSFCPEINKVYLILSYLYRTIKSDADHHILQTDLDKLTEWAMAWDMQFHPAKCLVRNITKKRHPSKFTYSLHNTDLKTTDTAKYLGITISQDMKWTYTLYRPVHVPTEHLYSSKETSKYDPSH